MPLTAFGEPLELRDAPKSEMRRVVDKVDELLGGTRTDDSQTTSTLRFQVSGEATKFTGTHWGFSTRFNLKLGIVQEWQDRFNHWLHKDLEELKQEFEPRDSAAPAGHEGGKRSASRANNANAVKDPWRFSLEKHLDISFHPDFWLHGRILKDWEFDHLLNTFSTEAGWSLANKWESITSFATSTHLNARWTMSVSNQARWQISDRSFGTSHGLNVAYLPGETQVMTAGASMSTAVAHGAWYADGYAIAAGYRMSAWKDWIFVGVGPFVTWTRSAHFAADPGANGHVEVVY